MASTSALLFLLFAALACSTTVFGATLAELEAEEAKTQAKATLIADKITVKEDKAAAKGSVKADPIITDFSGRTFGFGHDQDGAFFNVVSEEHHQMSMRLTKGVHGLGTYVGGIGVRYLDHQIIAERGEDDNLHVYINGERLHMSPGETEQEHTLAGAHGQADAVVTWQLAHPSLGQVAKFTDDLFSISVNVVPKSELEPAHLNFDVTLLREPEQELKGVVGGAYDLVVSGNTTQIDDNYFHGDEEEYLMPGYFAVGHMHDAFGRAAASARGASAARRQLIQANSAPLFPLSAHVGGATAEPLPAAAAAHVSGASRKFGP